jgi:hypothetical protein
MTTHGLLMAVACAAVAQAVYLALLREEWAGNPLLGFVIVAACVVCSTAVALREAFNRQRSKGGEVGTRKALLRSLTAAVVLIGATDTVFVASYLFLTHGRWYVVPFVDGEPELNLPGVVNAAFIAVGVAFVLRWAIWAGARAVSAISTGEPGRSVGDDQSRAGSRGPVRLPHLRA